MKDANPGLLKAKGHKSWTHSVSEPIFVLGQAPSSGLMP